jgi:hypothetical protein
MLPDHVLRPRLVLIRCLHGLAVKQSHQPEPQRGLSVLMLHDSVELFLQLAAEHRDARVTPDTKFLEYWAALRQASQSCDLGHKSLNGTAQ